ncbi:hypothetical protein ACFXKC_32420 [Streptomyces sp. NPDC059340]
MRRQIRWMDERRWGWCQWTLQLLIVVTVPAFIVPVVLYGSD